MKFLKNDFQNVKRNVCFLLFLLTGVNSFGQDTLFLTSNKKIPVKISYYDDKKVVYFEVKEPNIKIEVDSKDLTKIIFENGKTFVYKNSFEENQININNKNNTIDSDRVNDRILLKNGEEISAKVTAVSEKEISYKKADFLDGPTYTILLSNVFMITYSNGLKDVFNQQIETKNPNIISNLTEAELVTQAKNDAIDNFSEIGPFFAGFSSILLSPLFALIPAAIISSNEPNESKLNCPNQELFNKNLQYQNAYRKEAHKIKKKQVWSGYGVGVLFNTIIALVIIYG
jgi:hypothetical protein